MNPKKHLKEDRYYVLKSGEIRKVVLFSCKTVYSDTIYNERREEPASRFHLAEEIEYRPNIPALWELAKTMPIKERDRKEPLDKETLKEFQWIDRLNLFFGKLIEFDHVKINTLGYFYKRKEANKEGIGESIAYKLAERHYIAFSRNTNVADWAIVRRDKFIAWATNPTEETRKAAFSKPYSIRVDRECPVTGDSFQWSFDGKTLKPTHRVLRNKESRAKTKKWIEDAKTLRKLKNPSQSDLDIIKVADDLQKEFGWLSHFDLFHLAPVVPFKKAYGDPKTGKFPKSVVEIDIPTGELVFANSLFDYLKDFKKDEEYSPENSVNHRSGRDKNTQFHARVNQAFFVHVGNNSPRVWQNKKNPSKLRVGRAREEVEKGQWAYSSAKRSWVDRGYICTDLWTFHAVDRSRLPKKIEVDHFIVKLPPGRYRLVNHYEDEGYDTGIFCEISQVKPSKK